MALRRQIQPLDSKRCSQYSGVSTPEKSKCATPPLNSRGQQPRPSMVEVMPMTPGGAQLDTPFGASTGGAPTEDAVVQRLLQENASMAKRLARIEDEKSQFFDEGIFDLVNSVCGQSGSTGSYDDLVARFRRQWPMRPSPDASEAHSPIASNLMGPILASSSDISLSLGASCRNGEDQRAVELSGENAELRRELEQASRVSEALEWQQRAAEDRTHDLEEERLQLVERLRSANHGTAPGGDATGPRLDSVPPLPAAPQEQGAGRDEWLQDVNRLLQAQLELAESQAPPCQTPHAEEDRVLDLERKLRETEARAQILASENSQLQSRDEVRMSSPREFSMPAEFNVPAVTVVHSLADMSDEAEERCAGASPPWTPEGASWLAPPVEPAPAIDAAAEAADAPPLEALQIDEAW